MNINYIRITGTILLVFGLHSCSDFLDQEPISRPYQDEFYETLNETQLALNAVYNVLSDQDFQRTYWLIGEGCSDEATIISFVNRSLPDAALTLFSDLRSTNPWIERFWFSNYQGIFRANLVIEEAKSMRTFDPRPQEFVQSIRDLRQMVGQAKFLRALFYFNLVKTFGGVPIKPQAYELEGNKDNFIQPRSSRTEVYEYIEKDLREAIIALQLRNAWGDNNRGKVTKGAAIALLIKVLGYQGEPGVNHPKWQQTAKISRFFVDGEPSSLTYRELLNFDNLYGADTEEISRIKQELAFDFPGDQIEGDFLEATIEASTGLYNLDLPYNELWTKKSEFSRSMIFEINHSSVPNADDNVPTDVFDDLQDDAGAVPVFLQPSQSIRNLATNSGDPRLLINVIEHQTQLPDNTVAFPAVAEPVKVGCYKWYTPQEQRPNDGVNIPLLRFGEIILWYAEALNETGNQIAAVDQINKLRARARAIFLTDPRISTGNAPSDMNYTNYIDLRQRIWSERRIELCFEFDRFWDLIRTGQFEEKMAEFNASIPLQPYLKNFMRLQNGVFPIPQLEIDLSDGIVEQNPGY